MVNNFSEMSFLSSLLKKENVKLVSDFSVLKTDMHSHLIPGIDDGSKTIEESIKLLKELELLGYKKIITTPHVQDEFYKNTTEIISNGLSLLKENAINNNINIEIEAAAEYMLGPGFEKLIESGNLLSFGKDYILVEMSYFTEYKNMKKIFFELQTAGYNIILAHPERYTYYHNDFELYTKLKDSEIYFQLNIISLTGTYSSAVKKIAEKLVDNNLIEFLGTDLHNNNYLDELKKSLKKKHLTKAIESGLIKNNTL